MATATERLSEEYSYKKCFRDLNLHTEVALRFYGSQKKHKESFNVIYDLYFQLSELLPKAKDYQEFVSSQLSHYDFVSKSGQRVKANGHRSILKVFRSCCERLSRHLKACSHTREGVRTSVFAHHKTILPHVMVFKGLTLVLEMAVCLIKADVRISDKRYLFIEGETSQAATRIMLMEDIDREAYYGPCLGFQYSSFLKNVLQGIVISMATYEKWYMGDRIDPVREMFDSLVKGTRYIRNSTGRGEKVAELTQHSSIEFTKAFWATFELAALRKFMKLVMPTMETAEDISIPAKNLTVEGLSDKVTIEPPFSDVGFHPILIKLLSYRRREGQKVSGAYTSKRGTALPPSPSLLIHFHGGGFVSQSIKSSEGYLRPLAKDLDVPLVSINYSHAPESPFPRAFDECVYVYAWVLDNLEQLGTTGEKIVLFGDSAGGNLAVAVALKARQLGLRLPAAVVSVYPAMLCRTIISPSRTLSIMDPLLPIGILLSCLQAYTGCAPSKAVMEKRMALRALIQKHKGKKPTSDEAEKELKDNPESSTRSRSGSLSSRISVRKAVKTMSSVVKTDTSDSSRHPPRPPPPGSDSPAAMRRLSTPSPVVPPRRPPPPRANTVQSIPVVAEKPVDGDRSTPGLLEADLASPFLVDEDSDNDDVLESVSISEEVNVEPKKTAPPPVLATTNVKDSVLKPAVYPPEIEALAQEVIQSYQDSEQWADPYVSPYTAPQEMWKGLPPIHFVACELDPLLDDSVAMARKLQSYGHDVSLDVMSGMCHGFMSFAGHPDVSKAIGCVTAVLKKSLDLQPLKKKK